MKLLLISQYGDHIDEALVIVEDDYDDVKILNEIADYLDGEPYIGAVIDLHGPDVRKLDVLRPYIG